MFLEVPYLSSSDICRDSLNGRNEKIAVHRICSKAVLKPKTRYFDPHQEIIPMRTSVDIAADRVALDAPKVTPNIGLCCIPECFSAIENSNQIKTLELGIDTFI